LLIVNFKRAALDRFHQENQSRNREPPFKLIHNPIAHRPKTAQFTRVLETTRPLLFDSAFLSKLEQLYILSKKLFRGAHRAERRSRQIGSSLEFADYRNYTAGDDLRSIDWNIYGRLDRLFIKLFEQEQDLDISFLIDASGSMRWTPDFSRAPEKSRVSKFDQARRIAASLAYIGLANLDRVNIHYFGSRLEKDMGLCRGKSQFHKVLDFLREAPELEGETRLLPSLRAFAQRMKRRGLVFILSDFFDPQGVEEALAALRYHQFEVHVIQILDPAEIRPESTGDLRLVESETGAAFEITANDSLLSRYHAEIDAFLSRLAAFTQEKGISYAQASTAVPFEDLVLRVLRDGRMIQ
jgi:uncharacterized protein (DUF58 family)